MNNITYLNANAATTPSTRLTSFTLTDGNLLSSVASVASIAMNVGGAVNTYVWDGTGDGSSFADPLNWDLNTSRPIQTTSPFSAPRIPASSTWAVPFSWAKSASTARAVIHCRAEI